MPRSVKTNYILSLVSTGTGMLFPLMTFPYACRVIGAEGIGLVNFYSSIVSYIYLFTCLGIPMYAIREIARVRGDAAAMSRTAMEILLLSTALTCVGYLAVGLLCYAVPEVQADVPLFLVLSLSIFLGAIGCDWLYAGVEDFLYTTVRGLVVKIISVALLFCFVHTKDDLLWYGWYTVIGSVGGNVFNLFRLRKHVRFKDIVPSQLRLSRHIKPILQCFVFSVITSIYLQLNPVLLGFIDGAMAVGFFAAATKLLALFMRMSSCLGNVMMPRISNLIAENREEEFRCLIQKSYDFTLASCLPLTTLMIVSAPHIIWVFCGEEFMPSVLASQLVASNILMVALSNLFGIQVLYPKGRINTVTLCCGVGALVDILVCVLLIPSFGYIGAATAYMAAEFTTTLTMYLIAHKDIPLDYLNKSHLPYAIGCALMCLASLSVNLLPIHSHVAVLVLQAIAGGLVYAVTLLAFKDKFAVAYIPNIHKTLCRRRNL